jgi:hypothetical protein
LEEENTLGECQMIKKCLDCGKKKEMRSNQKYCDDKCKKRYENSKYNGKPKSPAKVPKSTPKPPLNPPSTSKVIRPENMTPAVAAYWDELAPVLEERGHLNILSKRTFFLYCVLQSKIDDILLMLDADTITECSDCGAKNIIPANRSMLQLNDKWDNKAGTETQSFDESEPSKLLRLYSARSLDYAKQLYLTPQSVRGNFGLDDKEDVDPHDAFLSMGGK